MQKRIVFLVAILLATMALFAQKATDFNVSLTDDGTGVVIKGYSGNMSKINIPAIIEGLPVREIVGNGYEQPILSRGVTSVVIPPGVTKIGNNAFDGCYSLVSVIIPEGVIEIGEYAFKGCSITSINLPKSLKIIGEGAFNRCHNITAITISPGLNEIKSNTFEECTSLTNIVVPEGVTKIGNSAFEECTKLSTVSLPSSIQRIESRAFMSCTMLLSISIPDSVGIIYTEFATGNILEYSFRNCPKLDLATQAKLRRLKVEFKP